MNVLSELLAIARDVAGGVIGLADLPGVLRDSAPLYRPGQRSRWYHPGPSRAKWRAGRWP